MKTYTEEEFKQMEKEMRKNPDKYKGKSFTLRTKKGDIITGIIKDINRNGLVLENVTMAMKYPGIRVVDTIKLRDNN